MRLSRALGEILLRAESEVIIFTPYFVPTRSGIDFWQEVINNGVQISLLTNSLASTNHVPVHGAYEGYRKELLSMGFDLYEGRPDAMQIMNTVDQASTLDTKLILIDRRYSFIGSLNMDPRSLVINTEMGILIDSKDLVEDLLENRDSMFEKIVYQLHLSKGNKLEWHSFESGTKVIYHKDPHTSWWIFVIYHFSARLKTVPF